MLSPHWVPWMQGNFWSHLGVKMKKLCFIDPQLWYFIKSERMHVKIDHGSIWNWSVKPEEILLDILSGMEISQNFQIMIRKFLDFFFLYTNVSDKIPPFGIHALIRTHLISFLVLLQFPVKMNLSIERFEINIPSEWINYIFIQNPYRTVK